MKIIKNKTIPFGRYQAINLFGLLFTKVECTPVILNHEAIHTAQMRELAFIGFYLWYVLEWLVKIAVYRDIHRAYLNVSFEREAYAHESDLSYLAHRPRWASFLRRGKRI